MTTDSPAVTQVIFWGTRGSIPTPGADTREYGGNTLCVSIQNDGELIILDAGTGIRNLGRRLQDQKGPIEAHLLLSHTHWDHIQGLPFFAPFYSPENCVTIYGSPRKGQFLESILSDQMGEQYFPVRMTEFAADVSIHELKEQNVPIGPFTVTWDDRFPHPGGCNVYAIAVNGKKIVYATDVELDGIFSDSASAEQAQLAQAYSRFIADADLLIADAQYTTEEYRRQPGWGHSTIPTVLAVAHEAGVKKVAVFHHDPDRSDTALHAMEEKHVRHWAEAAPPMEVFWAREGIELCL